MKVVIFPGSFDPFTRGHQAVVEQALGLFDRVVVGIGSNTQKSGLLTAMARERLIADLYAGEPRVDVVRYEGLTVDLARRVGAVAIIRGVRSGYDFEYERGIDSINRRLAPELTTIMLLTPASVADISSSVVRELLHFGGDVEEFMPQGIKIENYM